MTMRWMAVVVVAASALAATSQSHAQSSQTGVQPRPVQGTTITTRDENGRVRTKILVQKRSYLDGGTEVMPSDNIKPARSSFMGQQPAAVLRNTAADPKWAIDDPLFLPSNRPY